MNLENEKHALHNFRDFLLIYNKMTEACFNYCVTNFNSRDLDPLEAKCVAECASKFVKLNHKIMAVYVDAQQKVVSRRLQEAEAQALSEESKRGALVEGVSDEQLGTVNVKEVSVN